MFYRRAKRSPAMTMLGERTNGHAQPSARVWDASLQRIERQLAALGETGERRVEALRDALGQFVAGELETRDAEIATLQKHITELEHQIAQRSEIDERIEE